MNVTDKSILSLIVRVILISLTAALPCVAIYLWLDPFKVARHYTGYMEDPSDHPLRIGMNKGIVTLSSYRDNLTDLEFKREPCDSFSDSISRETGAPYNAFIFGSSISCYYDAHEWRDLLSSRKGRDAHPFHFDSASESPMSMARKVEYLHNTGAPLDYALVILDPLIMATADQDSPFSIDPTEFHNETLYPLRFHYTFFRAVMNFDFLKSFIAGNLTGVGKNFGHNPIFEEQPIVYDKAINQETIPEWDSLIRTDPDRFYSEHPLLHPADSVSAGKPVITGEEGWERAQAFRKIAEIFKEHNTDYELIISPNRRGVGLAPADLEMLRTIFGKDRVHDFSYTEAFRLRQDTMLYDNTHYRPPFASYLMRRVYLH